MNDEKIIANVVKKIKLPKEVKSIDFTFSDDSTGMPAVWINVHINEDYNPSAEKVTKLSAFKKSISHSLFEKNVVRWPYVRLVTD